MVDTTGLEPRVTDAAAATTCCGEGDILATTAFGHWGFANTTSATSSSFLIATSHSFFKATFINDSSVAEVGLRIGRG